LIVNVYVTILEIYSLQATSSHQLLLRMSRFSFQCGSVYLWRCGPLVYSELVFWNCHIYNRIVVVKWVGKTAYFSRSGPQDRPLPRLQPCVSQYSHGSVLVGGSVVSSYRSHNLTQCTNFHHNPITFHWDIACRHNIRPPSWICDDVIILLQVIEFYGPNTVLNFHVGWFDILRTNHTCTRLATDRRTDRQTDIAIV